MSIIERILALKEGVCNVKVHFLKVMLNLSSKKLAKLSQEAMHSIWLHKLDSIRNYFSRDKVPV